jgi:hypothetical protein
MVVVGRDTENERALFTIFDCHSDKFVKSPVMYERETFDEDLGTGVLAINDACLLQTPQF